MNWRDPDKGIDIFHLYYDKQEELRRITSLVYIIAHTFTKYLPFHDKTTFLRKTSNAKNISLVLSVGMLYSTVVVLEVIFPSFFLV